MARPKKVWADKKVPISIENKYVKEATDQELKGETQSIIGEYICVLKITIAKINEARQLENEAKDKEIRELLTIAKINEAMQLENEAKDKEIRELQTALDMCKNALDQKKDEPSKRNEGYPV